MNLVVPFGFYGAGNIGDESTLQGFARLLCRSPNGTRVWVASRNPSHTARVAPSLRYYNSVGRDLRKLWAHYWCDVQAVAGDTPITDALGPWPFSELLPLVSAARREGKPMAFVGIGTEGLKKEESKQKVSEILAPAVVHWSVRSARDKARLTDYGVAPESITVAADMAWLLDSVAPDVGRETLKQLGLDVNERFVGVNINSESFMVEREPQLLKKLGEFLDVLVERYRVQILFLCSEVRESESFDKATSIEIIANMTHREKTLIVPNEYRTPQELMSLIGCCLATISTRYHVCLFSALQSVPFMAIERSDKVADLCWDMKWPYRVPLDELSVSTLVKMFSNIDERRPRLVGGLERRVPRMRQRAARNKVALEFLAKELGR